MASAHARTMTPAAQHRKAMGDFHRKETTRVVASLRRAKLPAAAAAATAAVVHTSALASTAPRLGHHHSGIVALAAATLSLATLAIYCLVVAFSAATTASA